MHENALGNQFGSGRWEDLWEGYRRTLRCVKGREPYHLIAVDVRNEGRSQAAAARLNSLNASDRRRARLGLATSLLLDGGYFGFDRGDCLHGQLWWLPEYDVALGKPLETFVTGRYAEATHSRRYEKGVVVVNPGATAVVVSLPDAMTDASGGGTRQRFRIAPQDAKLFLAERDR
jgi:hypothetical protein